MQESTKGCKDDCGKNMMSLIHPAFLWGMGKVLTHGVNKYARNNWQEVDNPVARYSDATLRHINLWMQGEDLDFDSKLHHLLHAAVNLMFLWCFTVLTDSPKRLMREELSKCESRHTTAP